MDEMSEEQYQQASTAILEQHRAYLAESGFWMQVAERAQRFARSNYAEAAKLEGRFPWLETGQGPPPYTPPEQQATAPSEGEAEEPAPDLILPNGATPVDLMPQRGRGGRKGS